MVAEALEKDCVEQLVQIERDAAAFADSVGYSKDLFHDNEVILVRFLEKDYAFIANVDSVSKYESSPSNYDRFGDALKAYFRKRMVSGELEGLLAPIPDASDRAFARIVIARCMNVSRQELSEMIEKYTDDLTNENQLRYLVQRFWHKEGYDLESYACAAVGVSYNMMLGDVSKRLDDGLGVTADLDYVRNNILFELRLAVDLNRYTGEEELNFTGGGFGVDVGATVFHTDRFFLRLYAGIGLGINELRWDEDTFEDALSPVFGAGALVDMYVNTTGSARFGLRIRSGIRNVGAGPLDISSGANFYMTVSFVLLETRYKEFEYKYPEAKK
ncbi:hypothetical protein [Fibrobacter sp. UWR2]|uniref:hypothetical protein n=1 Tax=Fibrobacter sp. UWR2 TaxID=1964352 RepID=UPI001182B5FB|nr:hypothetical protein [Fibrobacter sp. UWR2]